MKMPKFIFLMLIASYSIFADEIPKMYVLHINGIQTTRTEAEINRRKLQTISQINSNMVEFGVLYNPTGYHTLLQDLDDVSRQKAAENKDLTLDDFTQVWIKANDYPTDIYKPGTEQYETLKSSILPQYNEVLGYQGANFDQILNDFHNTVPPQAAAVLNLLDGVPGDYSKNKNTILLVPHSQGNLYANTLYTYLTSTEKLNRGLISIFGIATPASNNAGWATFRSEVNSYITSNNDYVIKQMKLFAAPNPVLAPNINIPYSLLDVLGHSFIDIYLTDTDSVEYIKNHINAALDWFAIILNMPYDKLIGIKQNINLPSYVSYNNELIFENNQISEKTQYKKNFHYYIPSFESNSGIMSFDALPGRYGINTNANENIVPSAYNLLTELNTRYKNVEYNVYSLGCYTLNNSRYCNPFKYNMPFYGTLPYFTEPYKATDKSLIMQKMPEMFISPDLIMLEELIIK